MHDDLPPNYLFPSEDSSSDDLTQLTTLLAGPQGTPYSQGLWRVHLKMPDDYPKSPPKATFKTRIWHPNVEELTGAVCVDTLKRDWKATLTLRDVLVVSVQELCERYNWTEGLTNCARTDNFMPAYLPEPGFCVEFCGRSSTSGEL